MATARRLTAAEAIRSLQIDEFDNSCDADEDTTTQSVMQVTLENSDLWDCDSDEQNDQPIYENFNETQSSINRWDTISSRAGVLRKRISDTVNRRRAAAENIFTQRSGPTSYSRIGVQSKSPLSAFRLFIDEPMLRSIQKYTIKHGQADDKTFSVELCELEKFIGLQIAHGVLMGKNTPIHQLRSKEWGHPIFSKTINRDCYKELMKHLRFDNCSTRRERRQEDKFCLISEIWNNFIENCKNMLCQVLILELMNNCFRAKLGALSSNICQINHTNLALNLGFRLMFVQNISATVSCILVKTPQETGKTICRQMPAYG